MPRWKNLRVVPLSLDEANTFVSILHRHHKPVVGHKFSIGVVDQDGILRGVAIAGRPVARLTDYKTVIEVTRLCTDGTPNTCSKLYGACARIAREMGYHKIQTFILEEEPGTSLQAAGFVCVKLTGGDSWTGRTGRTRRSDQPTCPKWKYERLLTSPTESK